MKLKWNENEIHTDVAAAGAAASAAATRETTVKTVVKPGAAAEAAAPAAAKSVSSSFQFWFIFVSSLCYFCFEFVASFFPSTAAVSLGRCVVHGRRWRVRNFAWITIGRKKLQQN